MNSNLNNKIEKKRDTGKKRERKGRKKREQYQLMFEPKFVYISLI